MQKCDILVRNVRVLTPQYDIADDQYIAICDNKIVAVGNDSQCLFASDTVIRGNGKLAMPWIAMFMPASICCEADWRMSIRWYGPGYWFRLKAR